MREKGSSLQGISVPVGTLRMFVIGRRYPFNGVPGAVWLVGASGKFDEITYLGGYLAADIHGFFIYLGSLFHV